MNPYVASAPVSPLVSHATPYPQTTPQQAASIQPGSITYTTTVGVDGQVVYHPFKAVAASYQTPQGVVSGIQWIPAEATSVLPANATPADPNLAASFRRPDDRNWRDDDYRRRKDDVSRNSVRYDRDSRRYDDDDYYRRERDEREREEDRDYRRREEREREKDRDRKPGSYGRYPGEYDKHAAADLERRMADLDLERRERDREREREREREYERERVGGGRSRRGSMYGGERPTSTYQPASGGNYPSTYNRESTYTAAAGGHYPPPSPRPGDISRPLSPYHNPVPRPPSPYHGAGAIPVAPHPISPVPRATSPYQPAAIQRATSPFQAAAIQRATSPYGGGALSRAPEPYGSAQIPPRASSPYHGGAAAGIYPQNHVFEGQMIRGSHDPRAPSPSPYAPPVNLYANPNVSAYASPQAPYGAPLSNAYGGAGIGAHASPRFGAVPLDPTQQPQAMLTVPEGFNRPPNRAQPYTQFEMLKVGDMDDMLEQMPRMPAVLVPHDVYHEDWIRLMTDLGMGWAGTMPVPQYSPDGRPPKRSTLVADVIDLWNASFFRSRGVEMILYKGRERRSGRLAGTVDMHLPGFDRLDVSSPSASEDSEDDPSADDRYRYGAHGGAYGRGEASARLRRERKAERAERRKRKMEKKIRKRAKELDRTYMIYLQCVPPTDDRL